MIQSQNAWLTRSRKTGDNSWVISQIGQLFNYIITEPIFNVLMLLYHLFGSMALSIIVLTLIVRLALFPLTLKQLKSTKATQAIQPLIADVRKKYKDQKEQYAAMQAIYKEYGVNPVAGCLPLLVQLPVLYGLFFALREALNTGNLTPLQYLHLSQPVYLSISAEIYYPTGSIYDLVWWTN